MRTRIVACALVVAGVLVGARVVAEGLDFVKLSSGTMTNNQATVTLTNGVPLRGYVKDVSVVLTTSPNATCTVAVATAPAHGMAAQTLYPSTAITGSLRVRPVATESTNLVEVAQFAPLVLMDDKIVLTVGTVATTGTVSAVMFVTYERNFP